MRNTACACEIPAILVMPGSAFGANHVPSLVTLDHIIQAVWANVFFLAN
jgi:hypothetical protein